jgi:transcriptional regulator with XRE-family HTH domain
VAAKTDVMVDVGRRLRDIRERRGMPKEQVALALRMSAGNWAHLESGRNQLKATMLPTLADLFGMNVADLAAELLEPVGSCQAGSDSSPMRQDRISANYIETDLSRPSLRPSRAPLARSRELVAAGR